MDKLTQLIMMALIVALIPAAVVFRDAILFTNVDDRININRCEVAKSLFETTKAEFGESGGQSISLADTGDIFGEHYGLSLIRGFEIPDYTSMKIQKEPFDISACGFVFGQNFDVMHMLASAEAGVSFTRSTPPALFIETVAPLPDGKSAILQYAFYETNGWQCLPPVPMSSLARLEDGEWKFTHLPHKPDSVFDNLP